MILWGFQRQNRKNFPLNFLLFYLTLLLKSCAYACAYVDAYVAHFTVFLCFVFCLSLCLCLRRSCEPGLTVIFQFSSLSHEGICVDKNTSCPDWRRFCTVSRYRSFMQTNCQRTCNFCNSGWGKNMVRNTGRNIAGCTGGCFHLRSFVIGAFSEIGRNQGVV